MKRKLVLIVLIMIFIFPLKVYAATTSIELSIDGDVKKNEEINILVEMKSLENLYAASIDFSYDKDVLNIVSITAGDTIKKYEDEVMELGEGVDSDNNKATYSFTFLGDKKGISGDGTLAIIKAKVLKDDNFKIDEEDMKIKLVKRIGEDVENYNYSFKGFSYNKEEIVSENEEEKKSESDIRTDENNNVISNNDTEINKENDNTSNDKEDSINDKNIINNEENINSDENEAIDVKDKSLDNREEKVKISVYIYSIVIGLILVFSYFVYKVKIKK